MLFSHKNVDGNSPVSKYNFANFTALSFLNAVDIFGSFKYLVYGAVVGLKGTESDSGITELIISERIIFFFLFLINNLIINYIINIIYLLNIIKIMKL